MIIQTPLEIYDMMVKDEIKKKHPGIQEANFLFAPPERENGFRIAEEKFGKTLFPIYFIFRNEPAVPTETDTSVSKFLLKIANSDNETSVDTINCFLHYQVDFYSNSMFDMNLMNYEYFKFMRSRFLEFDFEPYGIDFKNKLFLVSAIKYCLSIVVIIHAVQYHVFIIFVW